jgi:hypothetical protein
VTPTRAVDHVHCGRRRRDGVPAGHTWAPIIQDGRIRLGLPGRMVQQFAESDYCYGVGPLTMKVDRVSWHHPVPHDGDTWLEVDGTVIDPVGHESERRHVLVRAARLPGPPPRRRPRSRP